MTTISAKTILRSRNGDKVLSTLLLRYPRCIHAEFMTHRVFSRNAASSRAIPVSKLIQDVLDDPFIPLFWGKNQKGMQAGEEHVANVKIWEPTEHYGFIPRQLNREEAWLNAMNQAVAMATAFNEAGYHKQIVNRLLEPFAHITVLISSTEWDNFLELRDHPDAEPHIQVLAQEIRKCLDRTDDIQDLTPGEWHLPFADDRTMDLDDRIRLSVACAASTSYQTTEGSAMTRERANGIVEKLSGSPLHASPFEHQAQADSGDGAVWNASYQHRNFVGFCQYRALIEGDL